MTRLDIISDPICPWCYIGVTHLMRAMRNCPDYGFAISWVPFQLNPDMPAEGMSRQEYLSAKFGGTERAGEIYNRIDTACREAGLEVDFSRIGRTPNTVNAHRLLHWARTDELQTATALALFDAYFVRGEDIGDTSVLCEVAGRAGLDTEVIGRLLAGDADRDTVQEASRASAEMGVTGVPTFILGGKYALSGAQPVETWEKVIGELTAAAQSGP